ncbi:type I restriction-modification system subunit M [Thermoanaerobacter thermohydrosulfuricus]|uniref:class I SAM-dependent DNA methyltransferase n=1 Tax=Thermoanaerobacter thermohydrosulfuricus TaxID=1516 RepID=UPI000945C06C|nr:class I SAM-dependent DNA methyltransferase [Thermoanaerobacter thermohydrosulfuricus]
MGQNNDGVLNFASTLWAAADRLRNNMEPSEYKHIVLGLIFLKYISDAFKYRQEELEYLMKDPKNEEYYCETEEEAQFILEDKDEYIAANVFYVPQEARYEYIMANAQRSDIGKLIDNAMDLLEKENSKQLRGVLPKVYAKAPLDPHTLGEIVNLIGSINFGKNEEKDVLGRVYEYFLSMFAQKEGKGGGEFFTPHSVVKLLVEMIQPLHGRVFDPCCGSGGMFVQSMRFVEVHAGKKGDISVYGQESNPTTYRLCKMNLAIRGIEADIRLGNSYIDDQFKDLRADYILANPPFNDSAWGADRLANDVRWKYGLPPDSNANYAWIQHFIYHLAPNGVAGFVLANGSMTTSNNAEYEIRKRIIEDNLVDCMVALPPQLFYTTGIPACLWFIRKGRETKETLFIDARKMGVMVDRTHRELTDEEIQKIAQTYQNWRNKNGYQDIKGFCASVSMEVIAQNDYILAPGRYVGVEDSQKDDIPFEEKMAELTEKLYQQMKEARRLDEIIKANLEELGYGE